MARIGIGPAIWRPLPPDLAAELGQTIASFGHLEDMLKRAIFAMERARLDGGIGERDFRGWLARMDHVATDSLGTLIDRLERTLIRAEHADPDLIAQLNEVKGWRNLLCHAAWQPTAAGSWQPVFVNTGGEIFDSTLTVEDLRAIRAMTMDSARRSARIIHHIEEDSTWAAGE